MAVPKFLQSYVVPVCTYEQADKGANVRSSQGTGVFVNNCGVFLTAAHVLNDAFRYASVHGQKVGLCVKGDHGNAKSSFVAEVNLYENAPHPFDVSIGMVPYFTDSPLNIARKEVSPWQEVATLGYPLSASGPVKRPEFDELGLPLHFDCLAAVSTSRSSKPRLVRPERSMWSSRDFGGETNPRKLRFRVITAASAVQKFGFGRVPEYRLYSLDGADKVASAEWFEADDDGAAVEAAKQMMDGHDCELWARKRLVARLPRKGGH